MLNALNAVRGCQELPLFLSEQELAKTHIIRFEQELGFFNDDGYKNFPKLKRILGKLHHDIKESKIPEFANSK